ncbi:ferrous iron transporter FeoB [Geoglobus ahangari]|uniref:Ferrous iron transport protein B n=1 Tax=Geoglobus ahangari TaxID=113653 RepID=A0A0F7IGB7_9EURY|nr:ferrous iron transport protein B [Geoglobus ahangari]AKG92602.1 ferrous iron transporter FeoB [Geoglobus ahangari]
MKVAMVGNPNVGKTTILNRLTGESHAVGNYPGTTVEVLTGRAKIDGTDVEFVDLPGIYSLDSFSRDEQIVKEFLTHERPDLILLVMSAASVERGIYLALRLSHLAIPMVIALNMVDEARRAGLEVDAGQLEGLLGVPVVSTVAVSGEGMDELRRAIASGGRVPKVMAEGEDEALNLAEELARRVTSAIGERATSSPDVVFTDTLLGIPVFLAVMWLVFRVTYDVASPFVDLIEVLLDTAKASLAGYQHLAVRVLSDGVITGVGSVLIFLPNIFFLFAAISFLELTGFLPRAVIALDGVMSRFGLVGRSTVPLMLGFGCNVPAVMATRSIEDERSRKITILVLPFISCSARLPIYVLLSSALFPGFESMAIMFLYLLGMAVALTSALVLRKTVFGGEPDYVMEIPPLRWPSLRDVWTLSWGRTRHFLVKAGTVILAMSVVLWYLTSFPSDSVESSYAGMIGKAISPLFSPFGWDWRVAVAVVAGFVAKEVVVETLGIVSEGSIAGMLTQPQALALMVFTLLYVPCFATIATIKAEEGWKFAAFTAAYTTVVAYLLAYVVYALVEVVM